MSPRPTARFAFAILAAFALFAAAPTHAQMIFEDDFETGTVDDWDGYIPLETPACNCYFSSDCDSGSFCDWGPGGPSTEDICDWTSPKPSGSPGAGCNIDHVGPWGGDICDGVCAPRLAGSIFGWEDQTLVRKAIELWAEAILTPAEAGGGPVNVDLAQEALRLPFLWDGSSWTLARHVNDLLIFTSGQDFYDHFCHFENNDIDPAFFVDLSGDPCKVAAGRLGIRALLSELQLPGSGAAHVRRIADHCPTWQTQFAPRCPAGEDAMGCAEQTIEDLAIFLSTPRRNGLPRLQFQLQ